MNSEYVIKLLDGLTGSDREADHGNADDWLLDYLSANGAADVAEAYKRARQRCGFWYA